MSKVKVMPSFGRNNYINIPGFMVVDLKLYGLEVMLYAIIYGYSQDGKSQYNGGLKYICQALLCTKKSALRLLQNLEQKGAIIRHEYEENGISYVNYSAVFHQDSNVQLEKNRTYVEHRPKVNEIDAQNTVNTIGGDNLTPPVSAEKQHGGGDNLLPGVVTICPGGGDNLLPINKCINKSINKEIPPTPKNHLNPKPPSSAGVPPRGSFVNDVLDKNVDANTAEPAPPSFYPLQYAYKKWLDIFPNYMKDEKKDLSAMRSIILQLSKKEPSFANKELLDKIVTAVSRAVADNLFYHNKSLNTIANKLQDIVMEHRSKKMAQKQSGMPAKVDLNGPKIDASTIGVKVRL